VGCSSKTERLNIMNLGEDLSLLRLRHDIFLLGRESSEA
jgi:hypothetical protein